MSSLVPCPSCARHVRASESACPFCASVLPEDLASRTVPAAPRRLERLAAFTFAATLAVAGCSAGEEDTDKQEGEIGSIMPMYGMPPPALDAGLEPAEDGGCAKDTDPGGFAALYGMPSWDEDKNENKGENKGDPCNDADAGAGAGGGGGFAFDGGGFFALYGMPAD